jgi:hypothetical protein
MATIVQFKPDGQNYILLGTGFGAFKATRPSMFLGNLIPTEDQGELKMVSVCDAEGTIRWAQSSDVTVVEVDGQSPAVLLGEDN